MFAHQHLDDIDPWASLPEQGPRSPAISSHAMVSTSHPAVTEAALAVLRSGGNAVDAMLTAIPLQQVLEPQLSTIAGGSGMLYWDSARGEPRYLNAHPDHPRGMSLPAADSVDTSGSRIAVPGTVMGMRAAAERFGNRPWASYFAPAIEAARDGFPMYSTLYGEMLAVYDRISHYPSGRDRYLPDGYLTPVGRNFRQPRLAAALGRLAQDDGADWFQQGEFAEHFIAAVRETGGAMTIADMRAFEPRWITPLRFSYRGHTFLSSPPPDSGGLYCGLALGVLERTSLSDLGPWPASPRAIALIARALSEAGEISERYNADPLTFSIPVDELLQPAFLAAVARVLEGSFPIVDLTSPATASVSGGHLPPSDSDIGSRHTNSNQLIIVDEQGNWVSALHTGYAADFGTGLVVDGIGVNAANVFPGVSIGAGRRICTPMAAVLGLRDGRPWLGLGTPGYPPPYVTLMLLNLIEYGMSLEEAVNAPRFQLNTSSAGTRSGWNIGRLTAETRLPHATIAGLTALGLAIEPLGDYGRTGSMQAVMADRDSGQLIGVTDPRRTGSADGY